MMPIFCTDSISVLYNTVLFFQVQGRLRESVHPGAGGGAQI